MDIQSNSKQNKNYKNLQNTTRKECGGEIVAENNMFFYLDLFFKKVMPTFFTICPIKSVFGSKNVTYNSK